MKKRVKTANLKIGMYVYLGGSWFSHPFASNEFEIKTEVQLQKIKASRILEVEVDFSKSLASKEVAAVTHKPEKEEVFQKEKKNFSGEDIQKIVERSDLSLKEKARSVYSESLEIVENIFENPSVDVLAKGKKEIYAIVDFILANEETPVHLLDILSHDFYTYTHSVNVGVLAVALSKRLYKGSNAHDLQELGAGYFLHDLGKVRVDPGIINKPGPLDEREMKTMKTHPYQGYKLLREAEQLSFETKVIVMQHHEREDGTGYPKGLRGEEIHDYGRVGCIADVFDALTAERSYKRSLTPFQALKIMKEEMIGHFHREIFEKFVRLFAASR